MSIAEILGIENTSINARKLVDSIRMKIEIKGCTEELLVAIQKREMTVLEAAISRANKIITHSDDMRLKGGWLKICQSKFIRHVATYM